MAYHFAFPVWSGAHTCISCTRIWVRVTAEAVVRPGVHCSKWCVCGSSANPRMTHASRGPSSQTVLQHRRRYIWNTTAMASFKKRHGDEYTYWDWAAAWSKAYSGLIRSQEGSLMKKKSTCGPVWCNNSQLQLPFLLQGPNFRGIEVWHE